MFGADASRWAGNTLDSAYQCSGLNLGAFAYQCQVGAATQGVCQSGCATRPPLPAISGLSTSTGQSGTQNQLMVHGTNLTLDTKVELTRSGATVGTYPSKAVAISNDSTSLTVLLHTGGAAPGTYDVSLVSSGSVITSDGGTLHDAYTVTAAPTPARSTLVPLSPTRFLDTRYGTGAPKARVGAGGVVQLKVTGVHGVPANGVNAVIMNVTAVNPTTSGFVTVYPDGSAVPEASNLNFTQGETISNLVVVPVVDGRVTFANHFGTVHVVADLNGYFTSATV
ncbi:hypothetical protein [Streptomyces sp. NBC_01477]|uniref:hypothetical protein n=1 Tax=Streptomyces sp. NBC_01477 TaxID=2976015 RepID=UPI002E2EBEC0|nr:hypothetical protein [Streptomyces sp. NBC_01477]